MPSPVFWALSRSIHATTSFDAAVAVPGEIYSRAMGRPLRYRHVLLYHSREAEPVDVIVYRGKGFQEPWFLIVPPDSEAWLPTAEVVRLYRQRMQIEQCFRDWKSHLGLRGLHLQVQKSDRLLRELMGFTLAYLMVLLLGTDPFAEKLRPYFKQQRRKSLINSTRA